MTRPETDSIKNNIPAKGKDWVRILSYGMIVLCFLALLGLLGVMVWRVTNDQPEVYRVVVATDGAPDSLKAYNYLDAEQADSLIGAVKRYDDRLTQKYQCLVEQKEQDSQVFYWGSLIVGVVITVFGWFGFQSFTTIEDKAKRKAKNVAVKEARRTAWKTTKGFLDEEGKKQIDASAQEVLKGEAVEKVKGLVLDGLNDTIEKRMEQYMPASKYDELEKRLEALEKSVIPAIETSVREAVNEVLGKYRRPVNSAPKKKEEEK